MRGGGGGGAYAGDSTVIHVVLFCDVNNIQDEGELQLNASTLPKTDSSSSAGMSDL